MVDAKKRPWSLEVHPVSFGNMESSDSISLRRILSRLGNAQTSLAFHSLFLNLGNFFD
jgi:hypothetical protein